MPQHRPGSTLVTACAALGGCQLGFMEVKLDISPQPPVVRNYFFWKGWERETGLLRMKMQTKGSLLKPFKKSMVNIITVLFEVAGFWNGANSLACFV